MRKSDFGAEDLFAGMRFQQKIEHNAFILGGKNYKAPAQLFKDFKLLSLFYLITNQFSNKIICLWGIIMKKQFKIYFYKY